MFENLLHQCAELGRTRKIRAIAREIDAGKHDFAIAARAEAAHLSYDLSHRHRARIAAAIGNDAEGAAMVAAVLHLHEGARPAREAIDEMRGHLREGLGCDLRGAAGHHDRRAGTLALETADGLARLPYGLFRHRAGIDNDGIGQTGTLRLTADHLALIGIEPAAEGDDFDAHRFALPLNRAGSNLPSHS